MSARGHSSGRASALVVIDSNDINSKAWSDGPARPPRRPLRGGSGGRPARERAPARADRRGAHRRAAAEDGVRAAALGALLLPYLYYGVLDGAFHFRGRRVSASEHLLHLAVGV